MSAWGLRSIGGAIAAAWRRAAATPLASPVLPAALKPPRLGMRILRRGVSPGDDVAWLQHAIGMPAADGRFGPLTAAALVSWQDDQPGLLADGVAGPATWRALGVIEPEAPPVFMAPLATSFLSALIERALRAAPNTFEPAAWAAVLAPDMERAGITTPARIVPFLANIHNETGGLRRLEESLYYSEERMMEVWPGRFPTIESAKAYARNPAALAERTYGGRMGNTRPGDGWRFRGRGGYQTTGGDNYRALEKAIGIPLAHLTADDSPLLTRPGASAAAAMFWTSMGANAMADAGESRAIRIKGNGGEVGLDHVLKLEGLMRPALASVGR